jgi:hypothetical protein
MPRPKFDFGLKGKDEVGRKATLMKEFVHPAGMLKQSTYTR